MAKVNTHIRIVLAGTAALATITFIAFRLGLNLTAAAFLHLIPIVYVAPQSGFVPASPLSLMAMGCQLYSFVPPVLTWGVAVPGNWAALVSFEYCALVVSRLSATAVRQKQAAESHRLATERFYETSRVVLLLDGRSDPGPQLAGAIQQIFHYERGDLRWRHSPFGSGRRGNGKEGARRVPAGNELVR